jgi:hypothetical protein
LNVQTLQRFDRGGVVSSRLVQISTHALVLVVALGIVSYTSVSRSLPNLRLGTANSGALSSAQGGAVNNVALGREGVVIKPISVPTDVQVSHDPIHYVAGDGESLQSIAGKFNLTVNDILWSNPTLSSGSSIKKGSTLLIPPIAGVVIQVRKGDSIQSLAAAWHVDPVSITDFNYIRDPVVDLTSGRLLVLPAAWGSSLTSVASGTNLPASLYGHTIFAIKVGGSLGPYAVTRFPYGYCTYYVATKVQIPWLGNAWQWYSAAQSFGWPVGATPRVGSIMVDWESRYYGHVAYVESVYSDGSWVVSEMNYVGWGVIDQRAIKPGQVPLIGFVYTPGH